MNALVDHLASELDPEVVHLSNALLVGIAPALKKRCRATVACTLQDEDTWLDAMRAPYDERCRERIREAGAAVDVFIPVSRFYAARMAEDFGLPADKMVVVPPGVDVDAYAGPPSSPEVPTVGFLSQITSVAGVDRFVEAVLLLRQRPGWEGVQPRITGGPGPEKGLIRRLRKRLRSAGLDDDGVFVAEAFKGEERLAFLRSLSVLSVPSRHPEAFGHFILEAMAAGVPVVQPNIGAYPEVLAHAPDWLYEPNTAEALADTWQRVLTDTTRTQEAVEAGRRRVRETHSLEQTATGMVAAYAQQTARN